MSENNTNNQDNFEFTRNDKDILEDLKNNNSYSDIYNDSYDEKDYISNERENNYQNSEIFSYENREKSKRYFYDLSEKLKALNINIPLSFLFYFNKTYNEINYLLTFYIYENNELYNIGMTKNLIDYLNDFYFFKKLGSINTESNFTFKIRKEIFCKTLSDEINALKDIEIEINKNTPTNFIQDFGENVYKIKLESKNLSRVIDKLDKNKNKIINFKNTNEFLSNDNNISTNNNNNKNNNDNKNKNRQFDKDKNSNFYSLQDKNCIRIKDDNDEQRKTIKIKKLSSLDKKEVNKGVRKEIIKSKTEKRQYTTQIANENELSNSKDIFLSDKFNKSDSKKVKDNFKYRQAYLSRLLNSEDSKKYTKIYNLINKKRNMVIYEARNENEMIKWEENTRKKKIIFYNENKNKGVGVF